MIVSSMLQTDWIKRQYREAYLRHGRSPSAVLCPKGRQSLRYAALLARSDPTGRSLLDFGCGLAHLCDFLDEQGIECQYTGVDFVQEFIDDNTVRFPNRKFVQLDDFSQLKGDYDIVLASGVFNIKYVVDENENRRLVEGYLKQLFSRARHVLSVDFMTMHVDFSREEAYHPDPAQMLQFAIENIGRRVVLDHSYLPYEFCLTIFRDQAMDRERGVYANS